MFSDLVPKILECIVVVIRVKTLAFCKLLNQMGVKFFSTNCCWSFFQFISPLQAFVIFSLLSVSTDQKNAVSFTLQMVSLSLHA
jgi:hypothetical protein